MQHALPSAPCAATGCKKSAYADATPVFYFTLGVESSIDRGPGQSRILSLPTWAGISTLAVAPGCCGFTGPVPSATLDKRCRFQQRKNHIKTKSGVKG